MTGNVEDAREAADEGRKAVPENSAPGRLRSVLKSPDLKVAAYFAVWLTCLLGFCYFVLLLNPNQPNLPRPMSFGSYVSSFFYYDGAWLSSIARHGYVATSVLSGQGNDYVATAFFPLYPATVRLVSYPLGGHYYAAGLLVSWASLLGCLLYLRRLMLDFRRDGGEDGDVGLRACLCLLLFPTAFFLAAGYSEALFMLCAVAAFYHARRSSWVLAGVWGYLACLARPVGLAVAAAIWLEALRQAGWKPRNLKPRMAALLAAPLGLATYMAYLWWRFSDPFIFNQAQKVGPGWGRELNLKGFFQLFDRMRISGGVFTLQFAQYLYVAFFTLLFVVLLYFIFRRYGYPLAAFSALCLLPTLLTSPPSDPMMSMNRLVIVAFPAFMLFAEWSRRREVERAYRLAGTLGLAVFTTLFMYGHWAG